MNPPTTFPRRQCCQFNSRTDLSDVIDGGGRRGRGNGAGRRGGLRGAVARALDVTPGMGQFSSGVRRHA